MPVKLKGSQKAGACRLWGCRVGTSPCAAGESEQCCGGCASLHLSGVTLRKGTRKAAEDKPAAGSRVGWSPSTDLFLSALTAELCLMLC